MPMSLAFPSHFPPFPPFPPFSDGSQLAGWPESRLTSGACCTAAACAGRLYAWLAPEPAPTGGGTAKGKAMQEDCGSRVFPVGAVSTKYVATIADGVVSGYLFERTRARRIVHTDGRWRHPTLGNLGRVLRAEVRYRLGTRQYEGMAWEHMLGHLMDVRERAPQAGGERALKSVPCSSDAPKKNGYVSCPTKGGGWTHLCHTSAGSGDPYWIDVPGAVEAQETDSRAHCPPALQHITNLQ